MSGAIFKTVLSLCFVALLAACSAGPASTPSPEATSGKAEPTAASSTSGEEVFFPQVRPTGPPLAVPSARGGGKLALDDKGCIRMLLPGKGPESGWVPVWPSDFELDTGGGKVRILNGRGKVVAEVGKRVVMGGGDITKRALRENEILDERTWRELFERCPPGYSYWLVGEGVHILSGGGGGGEEWPEKVVARVSGTQGIKFSGYVGTVLKDRRV
jgi:hypothetical protein